jgi:hypothetical protein
MVKQSSQSAERRRIDYWKRHIAPAVHAPTASAEDRRALSALMKPPRQPPIMALRKEDAPRITGKRSPHALHMPDLHVNINDILSELDRVWRPLFNRQPSTCCEDFSSRYRQHVQPALCDLPALTGEHLYAAAERMHEWRAVGLDGWRAAEVKDLPCNILAIFADLFNSIENGASWPSCLTDVSTTMIPKKASDSAAEVHHSTLVVCDALSMRPINNVVIFVSL